MANKLINFGEQILAQLQGDEDKAIALKNSRKAKAAVKGQLSALEGKLVDCEDNLDEKVEALELAKYPTTAIQSGADNSRRYVENLLSANYAVDDSKDEIEDLKETIAFLEKFLKDHKF